MAVTTIRTKKGNLSLRKAINAFCKHCIYDPGSGGGTWREQVEACTSTKCPLFQVRPLPQVGADHDRGSEGEKRALPAPSATVSRPSDATISHGGEESCQ